MDDTAVRRHGDHLLSARPASSPAPGTPGPSRPDRSPVALSVAGTDPSGGAGADADLKTFTARGVYGTSVLTALVAQNTHGVTGVHSVDADFVSAQFDAVLEDMPVDAAKTGMLSSRDLVALTARRIRSGGLGFLVVDPVSVSTSGHRLLATDAIDTVREELLPLAGLVTPNLPEAALLLGEDVAEAATVTEQQDQARELVARGAGAVLLKGGHSRGDELVDVLALPEGSGIRARSFTQRRIDTAHTHGTGCTLSAALTAEAAMVAHAGGDPARRLEPIVAAALDFLRRAMSSGAELQQMHDPRGAHGPVDHLVDVRR